MGIREWLSQNLFNLFTVVGILGSWWCSIVALRRQTKAMESDAKARRASNLLAITANHRELWKECVRYAGRFPGEPGEDTPKYKLPQGFRKSLELFNIDRAGKEPADQPLIIVEGFFGCMKFHQFGFCKVVALMGSTMSAAQEELIKQHTDRHSQVIVMLDEDEAGRAGREDIAVRLAKFVFVKVHIFDQEGQQPDNMSAEEVQQLFI
jgi:5S rRNA maturation endonuclease (ribonuclease M5)